jgi:hypothetical protein
MPELARQPVAERLARAIGVVTAGYAASTLVRPDVLSRPTGLGSSASTDVLVRAVGVRDLVSGAALALAPGGRPQQVALLLRIGSDLGDAVSFAAADLPISGKRKAVSVAVAWAGLGAAALVFRNRGLRS